VARGERYDRRASRRVRVRQRALIHPASSHVGQPVAADDREALQVREIEGLRYDNYVKDFGEAPWRVDAARCFANVAH
jgi:hypothetical protein